MQSTLSSGDTGSLAVTLKLMVRLPKAKKKKKMMKKKNLSLI